jgi:hypothetical protein
MTLMLQLATTLVIELGLSYTSAGRSADHRADSSLGAYLEEIPSEKQLTLEESRAVLGLDFMYSVCVIDHEILGLY